MKKFRESGSLLIGVEVDGKLHRDFLLRPRLVRDSVTVLDENRAQSNDAYRGVALIACQVEELGSLTREQITTDLLLSMYDADLAVIMEANSRLEGRLQSFRVKDEGTKVVAPSVGENRHSVA